MCTLSDQLRRRSGHPNLERYLQYLILLCQGKHQEKLSTHSVNCHMDLGDRQLGSKLESEAQQIKDMVTARHIVRWTSEMEDQLQTQTCFENVSTVTCTALVCSHCRHDLFLYFLFFVKRNLLTTSIMSSCLPFTMFVYSKVSFDIPRFQIFRVKTLVSGWNL